MKVLILRNMVAHHRHHRRRRHHHHTTRLTWCKRTACQEHVIQLSVVRMNVRTDKLTCMSSVGQRTMRRMAHIEIK